MSSSLTTSERARSRLVRDRPAPAAVDAAGVQAIMSASRGDLRVIGATLRRGRGRVGPI
jgi:hypothetical protein